MNRIEELRQKLVARVPHVHAEVDAPINEAASWFMDARVGDNALVVEWRPLVGFGVTSRGADAYGNALPDEFFGDGASALERVVDLLANDRRTAAPGALDLKSLRARRFASQQHLAESMGITQATVSKLEHRGEELSVAALRSTVAALGGQLELSARFGDRLVSLDLSGALRGAETPTQEARTTAHNLRNMFAAIRSSGEQLATAEPSTRGEVDTILAAAAAGVQLTNTLLGGAPPRVSVMGVDDRLRSLTPLLRRVLGGAVTLDLQLNAPGLYSGEAEAFDQALINLAVNARDAMPSGGAFCITTSADEEGVLLVVSDTGTGMSGETAHRAFEPFFTTKAQGTGLGLSMVHSFVTAAHGEISFESGPGGTTFRMMFPRARIAAASKAQSSRTVLVVDDDPLMRRAVGKLLMSNGFDVLTAERPTDALSTLKARKDVGLVVLDIMMPEMTGIELAQRFEDEQLDVEILFLSGAPGGREQAGVGSRPFLAKPFGNDELVRHVRAVLSAA